MSDNLGNMEVKSSVWFKKSCSVDGVGKLRISIRGIVRVLRNM